MEPSWLTVDEAAELLGLTRRAVVWRIHHEHLVAVKRGGAWFIDASSVHAEVGRAPFQRRRPA